MDIVLQIIVLLFLDIVLSVDNAILIASVTKNLEAKEKFWAQWLGALAAVLMRLVFIIIVMLTLNLLVGIPVIYITGGALLIYLGIALTNNNHEDESAQAASSILKAIALIMAGDIMMSFDNAFIIGDIVSDFDWTAYGIETLWVSTLLNTIIVAVALLISLVIIVFFADELTTLMNKYEWIIYIAGWLLISVGIEMIMKDFIWNVIFFNDDVVFDTNATLPTLFFEDKLTHIGMFFTSYILGGIIMGSKWAIFDRKKESV